MTTSTISIKLGEQGDAWQKRFPELIKFYSPTPNTINYSADWKQSAPGTVNIEHGQHSFEIYHVLSASSLIANREAQDGLSKFSINAGITAPDLISHDEARVKVYELLKKIEQAGWTVITGRGDPRLTGKERFNYVTGKDSTAGLGVDYTPSVEEWMRIENLTQWSFYANKQFLNVYFKRESSLLDPNKPGSYLLTFTLVSEIEHFRGYVDSSDRARWKELFPNEIATYPPSRAKAETTLKAQGIKIDETYQDPPLPNLK